MGNFIAVHVLKTTAPQLGNRGFDGSAKEIIMGNVRRLRHSGPNIKKNVRDYVNASEIRTAHAELLVDKILQSYDLPEEHMDAVGRLVCVYGFGMKETIWDKRQGAAKADNAEEDDQNEKTGAVTLVTNDIEVKAMIDTYVDLLNKLAMSDDPDDRAFFKHILARKLSAGEKTRLQNMAEYAIQDVCVSPIQAAGGKMAASGVTGTLDGAVRIANAFSIDELRKEQDFWTARFTGRATGSDASDPFTQAVAEFCMEQNGKKNAEGMGSSEVAANTMYRYMDINVPEFLEGLNSRRAKYTKEEAIDAAVEHLPKWCEGLAVVDPCGKNHTALSRNPATIMYVEAVEHGMPLATNFTEPIRAKDGGRIEAQGVQKILDLATSKAFRTGTVRGYVLLDDSNKKIVSEFEDKFRAAGVKVVHSLAEMREAIASEIRKMA